LSSGPRDQLQLASVTVAYERIEVELAPELASRFMAIGTVVTVRVEQAIGVVVYRVDVPYGRLDLAVGAAEQVSRELGLDFQITSSQFLKRHEGWVPGSPVPPCDERS
jgi:hypothetical protein